MRQYGSAEPGVVTGEYRFGDTRHIISDISALGALGWAPRRTPAESVAAYARRGSTVDLVSTSVLAEANATDARPRGRPEGERVKAFLLAAGSAAGCDRSPTRCRSAC